MGRPRRLGRRADTKPLASCSEKFASPQRILSLYLSTTIVVVTTDRSLMTTRYELSNDCSKIGIRTRGKMTISEQRF
jgi:hypothetical protein